MTKELTVEQANNSALTKLGVFAVVLAVAPILTYFASLEYLFNGTNRTFAALSAVVVANVILVAYIIVAVMEENEDQRKEAEKKKE